MQICLVVTPVSCNGKDIFARYKQPKDGGAPVVLYKADGKPCW